MKIIESGIQSKVIKIRHWVIVLLFLSKKKNALYHMIIYQQNPCTSWLFEEDMHIKDLLNIIYDA